MNNHTDDRKYTSCPMNRCWFQVCNLWNKIFRSRELRFDFSFDIDLMHLEIMKVWNAEVSK